jgi:FkbM family methyltransferase
MLKRIAPLRRAILRVRHGRPYVRSYSQIGEDTVVHYIFARLGIVHPTYIDIGANDPMRFNNTALLYEESSRGINIEPDPAVFKELAHTRKHDVNLNIGISDKDGEAEFYLFNDDKFSTFSKGEAERLVKDSPSLSFTILKVPTRTVDSVINEYSNGVFPDFLSLDVEGLDRMVLESIDYVKSAPKVICVETIKDPEKIESFLLSKGYFKFSGTFLNTIFCKKDIWENR